MLCYQVEEFLHLPLRELLPLLHQVVLDLVHGDHLRLVQVKVLESLQQLLLRINLREPPRHQGEEVREFHLALSMRIHFKDHLHELGFSGELVQAANE